MCRKHQIGLGLVLAATALTTLFREESPAQGNVQTKKFTIDQILSPGYPFDLVSAKKTDRIAWIAYERGRRNVYSAAAPDFTPVRLTHFMDDDGNDLSDLRIADDGAVLVFVRGHAPNGNGWVANPTSDPKGSEQAVWAVKTDGGQPWKVAVAGNPVLAPDGSRVLFTKDGQIHGAVVQQGITNTAGTAPLFLAYGTNSNPQWSPDSRRVAFVSNRGDHSFIGVYDLKNPKITYLAPGVDHDTSPTWSADGKEVAFIRRPGTPFGQQKQDAKGGAAKGKNNKGGQAKKAPDPKAVDDPAQGKQAVAGTGLTRATFTGGYTLAFWVANAETGKAREFWHNTPSDKEFTALNAIQWAGDNVIFSLEPQQWIRWYSVPVGGKGDTSPVMLTPGDGMVENVGLSSDGKTLYYCTNAGDIDRRHVRKVLTAGGEAVPITSGTDIETHPADLASGESVAVLFASAQRPQSVAVAPSAGGKARVIFPTLKAEFPLEDQVVPENVMLKAADGLEFHNQLFLPRDLKPGERRPAMVFVHGGPQRQMLLGYHYMHFYHMAYAINQYLASQGYIVLSVNYRGGIGYGKSFRTAPKRGAQGNSEYQDVLAAGQYLQARPDVDTTRIGIWGLSYGGILTAQALARNSDIFAAGVDMAGVHLWGTSIDPSDISYQSSAISHIDKWKSPVLLIHGDDDRNVAFSQTTGLVQLLRAHGIEHELIVFPDDVHDTLLYRRWITAFEATDDFFKRHLKK
jgi:dipeptidyl aminopeptidase/acylaminoacyl peptidase